MDKCDSLAIMYNDIADYSLLMKDEKEVTFHKELQEDIVNYLNASDSKTRNTYASQISSLYEKRYAEGTKGIQDEIISLDIETAFILEGISTSMNYNQVVETDRKSTRLNSSHQ